MDIIQRLCIWKDAYSGMHEMREHLQEEIFVVYKSPKNV